MKWRDLQPGDKVKVNPEFNRQYGWVSTKQEDFILTVLSAEPYLDGVTIEIVLKECPILSGTYSLDECGRATHLTNYPSVFEIVELTEDCETDYIYCEGAID